MQQNFCFTLTNTAFLGGCQKKKKKRWVYLHNVQGAFWEVVEKTLTLSFLKFNIIRKVSDELKWTQLRSFGKDIKWL